MKYKNIIGRETEIATLERLYKSRKSELLTDEMPDVDVTVVFHCLLFLGALALFLRAMKMREFIALCRCRLWNARHTINNKIHAKSMNLCLLILV